MTRPFKALNLALLIAGLALCQVDQVAAQTHGEVWTESELVVRPPQGPAMWRVQKGTAEVWIIGILPVMPKGQTWEKYKVVRALKGAKVMILPVKPGLGLGDMWQMMSAKNLPKNTTLKAVVPPDLYARYVAAGQRAGVSVTPFEGDRPVWAGARLRRDVLSKRRLSDDEPIDTLKNLAGKAGVKIISAGKYKLSPVLKDLNAMSAEGQTRCLKVTLDDIDYDLDRAGLTARAWAVGDLKTVHAHYQGSAMAACLSGSPKASALLDRSVDDAVEAIVSALNKPGKSVAVVSLSSLLRQDGALEQLRARGLTVTSPQ